MLSTTLLIHYLSLHGLNEALKGIKLCFGLPLSESTFSLLKLAFINLEGILDILLDQR